MDGKNKRSPAVLREIDGFYTRLIETSLTVKEPEQINCKKCR